VEVPLLEDVQKLFDQLNQKNVADEPEIESIIERNTVNIARAETTAAVQVETPQAEVASPVTPVVEVESSVEVVTDTTQDTQSLADTESKPDYSHTEPQWQSGEREGEFQVLYFEVADVLFAVPLEELGGIHRLETLSHLIGRPNWYLGLQSTRELKIDVVDTALWAMEDRLSGTEHQSNYEYIIMLDQSKWGLASNALKGTESLPTTSVNWRSQPGKRPWLAGMVKKKMCALIHVSAMIEMLDSGVSMSMLKNQKVVGNV
jgi:purine-binding chemotaxis protein CheW